MLTIFTLATGRSCTSFLTGLFAANIKNCVALHEAAPFLYGECIEWHDNGHDDLVESVAKPKWELIERLEAAGVPVYLESSHLFLKSWCDLAMQHFPSMKLIHLVRDPLAVASSYTNRDATDSRWQDSWLIRRDAPIFKGLVLTEYQRHLVAWVEVHNRAMQLLDLYGKHDDCVSIETPEALNDPTSVALMFERLGIATHECPPVIVGDRNANPQSSSYGETEEQQWKDVLKQLDPAYLSVFGRSWFDGMSNRGLEILRETI